MLEIFENEREPLRLILDVLFSLLRKWTLRPELRRERPLVVAPYDSVPSFHLIERERLGAPALAEGGVIALAVLFGLVTVLGHEVRRPRHPLRRLAEEYFKTIRVLAVLDTDRDLILAPWEIRAAPERLWKLDKNHDGKLSAEECGFRGTGASSPEAVERAQRAFMRENPVLAVLDSNRDGEISANRRYGPPDVVQIEEVEPPSNARAAILGTRSKLTRQASCGHYVEHAGGIKRRRHGEVFETRFDASRCTLKS